MGYFDEWKKQQNAGQTAGNNQQRASAFDEWKRSNGYSVSETSTPKKTETVSTKTSKDNGNLLFNALDPSRNEGTERQMAGLQDKLGLNRPRTSSWLDEIAELESGVGEGWDVSQYDRDLGFSPYTTEQEKIDRINYILGNDQQRFNYDINQSNTLFRNLDYLSDDQKNTLSWYAQQGDIESADRYLNAIQRDINERAMGRYKEDINRRSERAREGGYDWLADLGENLMGFYSEGRGVVNRIEQVAENLAEGKNDPVDPNASGMRGAVRRELTNENLYKDLSDNGIDKWATVLIQQSAQQLFPALLGGGHFVSGLFGLSTAGETSYRGALENDDALGGLVTALVKGELARQTEEILSAESLFGLDGNLPNAVLKRDFKEFGKILFQNMGGEAYEEAIEAVLDNVWEDLWMGGRSSFNQNVNAYIDAGMTEGEAKRQAVTDWCMDTLQSMLIARASAGIDSFGGTAMSRVRTQANLMSADNRNAVIQEGLTSYGDETRAFQNAMTLNDKENVSSGEAYEQYRLNRLQSMEDWENTIAEAYGEGLTDKKKDLLMSALAGERLSRKDARTIASDRKMSDIFFEYSGGNSNIRNNSSLEERIRAIQTYSYKAERNAVDWARVKNSETGQEKIVTTGRYYSVDDKTGNALNRANRSPNSYVKNMTDTQTVIDSVVNTYENITGEELDDETRDLILDVVEGNQLSSSEIDSIVKDAGAFSTLTSLAGVETQAMSISQKRRVVKNIISSNQNMTIADKISTTSLRNTIISNAERGAVNAVENLGETERETYDHLIETMDENGKKALNNLLASGRFTNREIPYVLSEVRVLYDGGNMRQNARGLTAIADALGRGVLTRSQALSIYMAGYNDFMADQEKYGRKRRALEESENAGIHLAVDEASLDKTQYTREAIQDADLLLKAFGLQGIIVDDETEFTIDGKTVKPLKDSNAFIDDENNTVYISNHIERGRIVDTIVRHEIVHRIRSTDPEAYETLVELCANRLSDLGADAQWRINQTALNKRRMDYKGQNLTQSEIAEEAVADAIGEILTSSEIIDIVTSSKLPSGFASKMLSIVRGVFDSGEKAGVSIRNRNSFRKMETSVDDAVRLMNVASGRYADSNRYTRSSTDGGTTITISNARESKRSARYDWLNPERYEIIKEAVCGGDNPVMTEAELERLATIVNQTIDMVEEFQTQGVDWLDMNETIEMGGIDENGVDHRISNPFKENSDPLYKISLDYSTLCKKRMFQQYIIDQLQVRLAVMEKKTGMLTAKEQLSTRRFLDTLQKENQEYKYLQVACGLCFVESARLKSPRQANKLLRDKSGFVKDYFSDKVDAVKRKQNRQSNMLKDSFAQNKLDISMLTDDMIDRIAKKRLGRLYKADRQRAIDTVKNEMSKNVIQYTETTKGYFKFDKNGNLETMLDKKGNPIVSELRNAEGKIIRRGTSKGNLHTAMKDIMTEVYQSTKRNNSEGFTDEQMCAIKVAGALNNLSFTVSQNLMAMMQGRIPTARTENIIGRDENGRDIHENWSHDLIDGKTVEQYIKDGGFDVEKIMQTIAHAWSLRITQSTKSKALQQDVAYYWGDASTENIAQSLIDNFNMDTGLRHQSWSDFEAKHLLDTITAITELSTRRAKMQAYTKVPAMARILGNTGMMINLSLIPTETGVKTVDGKIVLDFDNKEGMRLAEALNLRHNFSNTVGTICIAINADHLKLLLATDVIDYVIPYHASGMSKTNAVYAGLKGWESFTDSQEESRKAKGQRALRTRFSDWFNEEFLSQLRDEDGNYSLEKIDKYISDKADSLLARQREGMGWTRYDVKTKYRLDSNIKERYLSNTTQDLNGNEYEMLNAVGVKIMRASALNYLEACADRGLQPKFVQFMNEPNFWKLLTDTKMVNNTGDIIIQQAVKPIFNFNDGATLTTTEGDTWVDINGRPMTTNIADFLTAEARENTNALWQGARAEVFNMWDDIMAYSQSADADKLVEAYMAKANKIQQIEWSKKKKSPSIGSMRKSLKAGSYIAGMRAMANATDKVMQDGLYVYENKDLPDRNLLPSERRTMNDKAVTILDGVRFSEKITGNASIEKTKTLIARHNIQMHNLLKALQLGGFAMPSLAVVLAEQGHFQYGEWSFLFPPEMLDPSINPLAKLYGGDAWTQTVGAVEGQYYKYNDDVVDRFNNKVMDAFIDPETGEELGDVEHALTTLLDMGFLKDYKQTFYGSEYSRDALILRYADNYDVIATAVYDMTGKRLPPIPPRRHRVEKGGIGMFALKSHTQEYADKYTTLRLSGQTEELERLRVLADMETAVKERAVSAIAHYGSIDALRDIVGDENKERDLWDEVKYRVESNYLGDNAYFKQGIDPQAFASDAYEYWLGDSYRDFGNDRDLYAMIIPEITWSRENQPVGYWSTQGKFKGMFDWFGQEMLGLVESVGYLKEGKTLEDFYTAVQDVLSPEGVAFEDYFGPITLDQIVREMLKDNDKAFSSTDKLNSMTALIALASKDYESILEAKKDEWRLNRIPDWEYGNMLRDISVALDDARNAMRASAGANWKSLEGDYEQTLVNLTQVKNITADQVREAYNERSLPISERAVRAVTKTINSAQNATTGYFEAKLKQAVYFTDMAKEGVKVIAPTWGYLVALTSPSSSLPDYGLNDIDTYNDAVNKLASLGFDVKTYSSEAERTALMNSDWTESIRFSKQSRVPINEETVKGLEGIVDIWSDGMSSDDVRYSAIGYDAVARSGDQTLIDLFYEATRLESIGTDEDTIFLKTGWYRGPEKKWRYEIDNSKDTVDTEGLRNLGDIDKYIKSGWDWAYWHNPLDMYGISDEKWHEFWDRIDKAFNSADRSDIDEVYKEFMQLARRVNGANLQNSFVTVVGVAQGFCVFLPQVLDAPELYKFYPELRTFGVVFAYDYTPSGSMTLGGYLKNAYKIGLNKGFILDNGPQENKKMDARLKGTLLHETEHYIQDIEGFRGGTSPKVYDDKSLASELTRQTRGNLLAGELSYYYASIVGTEMWDLYDLTSEFAGTVFDILDHKGVTTKELISSFTDMVERLEKSGIASLSINPADHGLSLWVPADADLRGKNRDDVVDLMSNLENIYTWARRLRNGVPADNQVLYESTSGEEEAREVSFRGDYTMKERRRRLPRTSASRLKPTVVFVERQFSSLNDRTAEKMLEIEGYRSDIETLRNIPPLTASPEIKYSLKLSQNATAEINKILSDISYKGEVLLLDDSPAWMESVKGTDANLRMTMNAEHLRQNIWTADEARNNGINVPKDPRAESHWHGLGVPTFLQVLQTLDDPKDVYRGTPQNPDPFRKQNYFLLVSKEKDSDGLNVVVPVYINEAFNINRVGIGTVNKIATTYGKKNLDDYLGRETRDRRIARIKIARPKPVVDAQVAGGRTSVKQQYDENGKQITAYGATVEASKTSVYDFARGLVQDYGSTVTFKSTAEAIQSLYDSMLNGEDVDAFGEAYDIATRLLDNLNESEALDPQDYEASAVDIANLILEHIMETPQARLKGLDLWIHNAQQRELEYRDEIEKLKAEVKSLKAESKSKTKQSEKQSREIDRLNARIEKLNDLMVAVAGRIRQLKLARNADVKSVRAENKNINTILDIATTFKDWGRGGRFASEFQDPALEGFIKELGKIKYRSDISRTKARKLVAGLQSWYTEENLGDYYSQEVADRIAYIAERKDNTKYPDAVELQYIADVFKAIKHLYKTYDQMALEGRKVSIRDTARREREILEESGYSEIRFKFLNKVSDVFGYKVNSAINNALSYVVEPRVVYQTIDGFNEEGILTKMFNETTKAETAMNLMYINLTKQFDDVFKDKTYAKHYKNDSITIRGKTLSIGEAISLYWTANRQEAKATLESTRVGAGVVWTNERGKTQRLHAIQDVEALRSAIWNQLTEDDKALARLVHEFYTVTATQVKMRADERILGFTNIDTERDDYYPFVRDRNQIGRKYADAKTLTADITSAYNFSFNKDIKQNVTLALELIRADVLWKDHAKKLAMYSEMTEVLQTWDKILNANMAVGEDGKRYGQDSLRGDLQRMWKGFSNYHSKFMQDVQNKGRAESNPTVNFIRGAYATAQLGFNPKVIVSQTASYPTAGAYLDAESLAKGATMHTDYDLMDQYCPWAYVRNYDNGVVLSEGNLSAISEFGNKTTKPISQTDRFTIGKIWNACQVYIETHEGYAIGTEENLTMAGELLEKVCRRTQPNYTQTERSAMMRSTNEIVKSFTMFTSVPLKQLSRIVESSTKLRMMQERYKASPTIENRTKVSEAWGEVAKVQTAVFLANAMYIALSTLVRFLLPKKDEDKEVSVGKMAKDVFTTYMHMVPIWKDIYDYMVNGYDVNNYFYDTVNDMLSTIKKLGNLSDDPVGTMWDLTQQGMMFVGIPTRNMKNTFIGVANRFASFINASAGYEVAKRQKSIRNTNNRSYFVQYIYDALYEGDATSAQYILDDMRSRGYTDKDIEASLKTIFANEAYDAWVDGDQTELTKVLNAMGMLGWDESVIDSKVSSLMYKDLAKQRDIKSLAQRINNYNRRGAGNADTINTEINRVVQKYMRQGYSQDVIQKRIESRMGK